ncbi:hypothetical protein PARA125_001266 [Parachlamydia sp. AcF125]|nr:hypothetical protein [Parachlamydia sp. AcF125]
MIPYFQICTSCNGESNNRGKNFNSRNFFSNLLFNAQPRWQNRRLKYRDFANLAKLMLLESLTLLHNRTLTLLPIRLSPPQVFTTLGKSPLRELFYLIYKEKLLEGKNRHSLKKQKDLFKFWESNGKSKILPGEKARAHLNVLLRYF